MNEPYEIKVICDFSKPTPLVSVPTDPATPSANAKVKFVCDNATLVIIAQYHSRGNKETDHTPFASDVFTFKVPRGSAKPYHITVKGDEAIPPGAPDPDIKNPGYKYTVVATSDDGKVGFADPTIIIKQEL